MPYLYFALELVIYMELTLFAYAIFGEEQSTYIIMAFVLAYLLSRSRARLIYVLERCKSSELYTHFEKKVQEKYFFQKGTNPLK